MTERKQKLRNAEGITLIALVVTTIVLLILAGVSISMIIGDNGVLTRAREAKERWEEEQEREYRMFENMDLETDKATGEIPEYMAWNNNVYKQYSSGNVYGIGEKGWKLNTIKYEQEYYTWQEFVSPITNTKTVIPGYNTMYVIDSNDNLWAWGGNSSNKLGLTGDKKDATYIMAPMKITSKKVSKVYPGQYNTFIIEKDTNKIYVAGSNTNGEAGIGNQNEIDTWTEVQFDNNVIDKTVKKIVPTNARHTLIWFTDNTFYFAGTNQYGQIGDGTKLNPHSTQFVQIWNTGAYDIDQDIKDVLIGVSTMILFNDGTIMQSGHLNQDGSGGGGNLIAGNQEDFRKFSIFADGSVDSIYQVANGRIVKLKSGDIWATPGVANVVGIGEQKVPLSDSAKYYQVTGVPNNVKEIFSILNNVYYILENGQVYASGSNEGLGKGTEDRNKGLYIEKLNIPQIESGSILLNGDIVESGFNVNVALLKGKNGKLYTTGSAWVLYGLNSVQETFTKVASNVKHYGFDKYMDRDNNLWVAGENSLYYGFRRYTRKSYFELCKTQ